jgi:hypothetical protein
MCLTFINSDASVEYLAKNVLGTFYAKCGAFHYKIGKFQLGYRECILAYFLTSLRPGN